MKYIYSISIFLLLFFTFSIFYKNDSSFNQDLGRHLELGEIIVSTNAVPKTNLFSYTNYDFPFINHHFLFEVFVYLWNQIFNLQSVLFFKIFIILIAVSLILAVVKKSTYPLVLPLGYLFLHVLRERTDLRPEVFSYLFIALTFFILERFSGNPKSKSIFFLPFIQFIWVNTHIYFFLGFMLQAIYFIDCFIKKKFNECRLLASIFLISAVASLFNPNFLDGLFYPLRIFENYGYTIAENQNIFLLESIGFKNDNFIFVKICSVIILSSIIISFLKKTWSVKNILVILLGLSMALINIRSFPLLFFLCFPIVLQNFNIELYSKKIIILIVFSAVFLTAESLFNLNGSEAVLKEDGKPAMDFLLANDLPQPLYNNFDIGNYILYRGYPKYKVFVDGRPEAYPALFFQDIYIPSQSDYKIFKIIDGKYNFKTIIFSISDQTPWGQNFLKNVLRDKEWSVIYIDHFTIILVKSNYMKDKNLKTIDLSKLSAENFSFDDYISYLRLGYFLYNNGYLKAAETFIGKAAALKKTL